MVRGRDLEGHQGRASAEEGAVCRRVDPCLRRRGGDRREPRQVRERELSAMPVALRSRHVPRDVGGRREGQGDQARAEQAQAPPRHRNPEGGHRGGRRGAGACARSPHEGIRELDNLACRRHQGPRIRQGGVLPRTGEARHVQLSPAVACPRDRLPEGVFADRAHDARACAAAEADRLRLEGGGPFEDLEVHPEDILQRRGVAQVLGKAYGDQPERSLELQDDQAHVRGQVSTVRNLKFRTCSAGRLAC